MCELPNKQGWAINRFENVQLHFFLKSEKSGIWKFALFKHFISFALFKRAIVQLLCLKCNLENHTFCTFFLFALLKRAILGLHFFHTFEKATKSAIAQSHFWKERQKVWSHNRTFEKSDKKRDCTFALLIRAKKVWLHNRTFEKSDEKRDCTFALLIRAKKVQLHNCTFEKSKNVRCANMRLPNPGSAAVGPDISWFFRIFSWHQWKFPSDI